MRMTRKFAQQGTKIVRALQVCSKSFLSLNINFISDIVVGLDDEESTTHPSEIDPNLIWPSMQDMNTRLRRVITSYQRNYKKEELKQQQKAKVNRNGSFQKCQFRVLGILLYCVTWTISCHHEEGFISRILSWL